MGCAPSQQSHDSLLQTNGSTCFVYLFASPLNGYKLLDAQTEIDGLKKLLQDEKAFPNNHKIEFSHCHATFGSSLNALNMRPDILYISCHGGKGVMVIENNEGGAQQWTHEIVNMMLELVGKEVLVRPIQVAIIGACLSAELAELFQNGGNIRHIVAVKANEIVRDQAMIVFVRIFVANLLRLLPVKRAFKRALFEMQDDNYGEDAAKLCLISSSRPCRIKDFDTKIPFADSQARSSKCHIICPSGPTNYVHRKDNDIMADLFAFFKCNRLPIEKRRALAVLTARKGVGATTLASILASQLSTRGEFRAIYYIPLEKSAVGESWCERDLVHAIAGALLNEISGLSTHTTFKELLQAVSAFLDQDHKESQRILMIFDPCCVGTADSALTTHLTRSVVKLLQDCNEVSVLAICHNAVRFLPDGNIRHQEFSLGKMSDEDIAAMVLHGSKRTIEHSEIYDAREYSQVVLNEARRLNLKLPEEWTQAAVDQVCRELSLGEKFDVKICAFAKTSIVQELNGSPKAAHMFGRCIEAAPLMSNIIAYTDLAKRCAVLAETDARMMVDPINCSLPLIDGKICESPRAPAELIRQQSEMNTLAGSISNDGIILNLDDIATKATIEPGEDGDASFEESLSSLQNLIRDVAQSASFEFTKAEKEFLQDRCFSRDTTRGGAIGEETEKPLNALKRIADRIFYLIENCRYPSLFLQQVHFLTELQAAQVSLCDETHGLLLYCDDGDPGSLAIFRNGFPSSVTNMNLKVAVPDAGNAVFGFRVDGLLQEFDSLKAVVGSLNAELALLPRPLGGPANLPLVE